MTYIQYRRWKAYMAKGLMPPPQLDKIVQDAMEDSDCGDLRPGEYEAFLRTLDDIGPDDTRLSATSCWKCGKHWVANKRAEDLWEYRINHFSFCWVSVCPDCVACSQAK